MIKKHRKGWQFHHKTTIEIIYNKPSSYSLVNFYGQVIVS